MSEFRPLRFNDASIRANELVANTKLGIGTHSQSYPLAIAKAGTVYTSISDTSAGTDAKHWWTAVSGNQMTHYLANDLNNASQPYMKINRSGYTVDSITFDYGKVGISTTSPQEKFHLYGSPIIQHETRYDASANDGWYKIGTWDAASATGARLKISLLGAKGYGALDSDRGGETIIYASINNNNPTTTSNMSGSIHAHGRPAITQAKFKQVGNDRTQYEIIAYVETYTQHTMKIECSETTTFTRAWTSTPDPGADSPTVQAALFTHVVNNSGNVGVGTTNPTHQLHIGPKDNNHIYLASANNNYGWKIDTVDELGGYVPFRIIKRTGGVDSTAFTITNQDGRVGIGVASASYPLHVTGSASNMPAMTYFNVNSTQLQTGSNDTITIYADGNIYTNGLVAASDERIKKEIVDADDAECLETLRLLNPKKYRYRDEINRGQEPVWGFIAQEVRETLPYATRLSRQAIPNIYELANVSSSNVITFTNFDTSDLEANATTIQVQTAVGMEESVTFAEIIDEHTIRVEEDLSNWTGSVDETGNVVAGNQLFVYGQKMDDFVLLKKDAIWTVATAALQEVDRQQQADKLRIAELETQLTSVLARLDALENPTEQ